MARGLNPLKLPQIFSRYFVGSCLRY